MRQSDEAESLRSEDLPASGSRIRHGCEQFFMRALYGMTNVMP